MCSTIKTIYRQTTIPQSKLGSPNVFCQRVTYVIKQQFKGWTQGRTEFRWHLGQETRLASPCSSLSFFGSKCTVLKKVLATLLGLLTFGRPRSDSAPGALCPLSPLVTPLAGLLT